MVVGTLVLLGVFGMILVGCGNGNGGSKGATPTGGGGGNGKADTGGGGGGGAAKPAFDTATGTATIKGTVKFSGTAQDMPSIDMSGKTECPQCGEGKEEWYLVNSNTTVKNAIVYVKGGDIAKHSYEMPSGSKEINQTGCMYTPHVQGMRAGQELLIKNTDKFMHNI